MHYLDRNVDITIHETYRTVVSDYDRSVLAQVFDKECCTYFMLEFAAAKLAREKALRDASVPSGS